MRHDDLIDSAQGIGVFGVFRPQPVTHFCIERVGFTAARASLIAGSSPSLGVAVLSVGNKLAIGFSCRFEWVICGDNAPCSAIRVIELPTLERPIEGAKTHEAEAY